MRIPASAQLAARSCSFRVTPSPKNLTESRAILRLLQRFGDVSTYKWFRYEPRIGGTHSGMVIFRDMQAAKEVIRRSPVYFWMVDDRDGGSGSSDGDILAEVLEGRVEEGLGVRALLEGDEGLDFGSGHLRSQGRDVEKDTVYQSTEDARNFLNRTEDPSLLNQETSAGGGMSSDKDDTRAADGQSPPGSMLPSRDYKRTSRTTSDALREVSTSSVKTDALQEPTRTNIADEAAEPRKQPRLHATTKPRPYRITVEPWRGNHADYIERTKFWNKFSVSTSIPAQGDLRFSVPMRGLSDVFIHRKHTDIPNRLLDMWEEEVKASPTLRGWVDEREKKGRRRVKREDAFGVVRRVKPT